MTIILLSTLLFAHICYLSHRHYKEREISVLDTCLNGCLAGVWFAYVMYYMLK